MIDDESGFTCTGKFFGLAAKDDDLVEFLGDAKNNISSFMESKRKLRENYDDYQITLAHVGAHFHAWHCFFLDKKKFMTMYLMI